MIITCNDRSGAAASPIERPYRTEIGRLRGEVARLEAEINRLRADDERLRQSSIAYGTLEQLLEGSGITLTEFLGGGIIHGVD